MIKVENVTKKFNDFTAIDNLNLEISEGEIFGLLGENGAGKTTTLRILATMLKPTQGKATVCGYDTVKDDAKVRENIGILFGGETGLYDRLTARENIEYFGELYDMSKDELKKEIEKVAEALSMKEYIDKRVGTFSKGMKQKVALIAALSHNPKVLIMDEPFVGLDPKSVFDMKEIMREMCKEEKTIFFSTHILEVAEKLCSRVAIIKQGKLVKVGSMEEVKGDESLEKVFLELDEENCEK